MIAAIAGLDRVALVTLMKQILLLKKHDITDRCWILDIINVIYSHQCRDSLFTSTAVPSNTTKNWPVSPPTRLELVIVAGVILHAQAAMSWPFCWWFWFG